MQSFESGMPALALFAQHGTQTPLQMQQPFVIARQSSLWPLRLQPRKQMIQSLRVPLQFTLLQGEQALLQLL